MHLDEIKHTINEALRAYVQGIDDPCAESEETLKTQGAKQAYDESVLSGNAAAGKDALDSAGSLLSTGFQKTRYKLGEFAGDKLKAANTRVAAPITPETDEFISFAKRLNGKPIEEIGLSEDGRIADKQALVKSEEFKQFFGKNNYRMKGFREERVTNGAQEVKAALKSDNFARIFDDKNKFGRIISNKRLEQIDNAQLKRFAKQYNRAVSTAMIDKAAKRLVYMPSPKEAVEKYIEDSANDVRSTLGVLHKTWNRALETLPTGTDGISPEMNLDIIKELNNENSGNANASRFANVIRNDLYPLKRELLGDAGINYATVKNYLPTMHDAAKIAVNRGAWVSDMMNYLDLGLMNLDDDEARGYLERVWQGFEERAEGKNIDDLEGANSTAIGQKKKLIFKDAQSYLEYHEKYGKKSNIKHILSDFIDESAHQIVSARRYGDADGFHIFNDLVKANMKDKQNLGYAARLAIGDSDDVRVNKIKGSKANVSSFLNQPSSLNTTESLDNLVKSGLLDKDFLDTIRGAKTEDDIESAVAPFSKQFQNFMDFAERRISGNLPFQEKTLGDKTYNWISAGARGSLYAWMGVKGLIWDVGQRVLAETQTKDLASAIAESMTTGATSESHLNAIGMITRKQMHDLELKARLFNDNAIRNKFEAAAMRLNFSELYAESTQSATRTSLLYGITENLHLNYDELPQELKDGVNAKSWNIFRKIDERGDDFFLEGANKMNFKNPAKVLNEAGFNDEERAAANQIQAFVNDRASRTSQLADETTRIQRAQVASQYADNTLERAMHSSIFGVSNIMKAFSRKTAPLMMNLLNQGRYGAVAGLVLFSTMLGATNKIASLLIEGKTPTQQYFQDPAFWLDSMSMGGLVTNWAVSTALQVHDSQDFKTAVATTMYGSGLQASYDLYQLSGSLLTGDTKQFKKYSKAVLDNDFSIKRIPVAGLTAQRLIMDPIVNALDPEAAMHRQSAANTATQQGTPYYWQ